MSEGEDRLAPVADGQLDHLDQILSGFEASLSMDPVAMEWLAARGLGMETAERFRLGLVEDAAPGFGRYQGMLCIPYLGVDGRPFSLRFRCLESHEHRGHGKYMSMSGDHGRLFNVRSIHAAGSVIHLTEGELDALTLEQIGFHAVASPGATSFKPHHARMLAGFSRVWVWGDPDDAGAEFVSKIQSRLRQAVPVRITEGDVNEVFVKQGPDALRKLVQDG